MRKLWHASLSTLALLLAVAAHAAPVPLQVQGFSNATVPLDGTWQFHLGDNAAWAAPALDDSGWEPITADKPWGAQTHYGYTGYAWYRRHIDFVPVAGANPDLALYLPHIDDASEIYWNGKQIGQIGNLPPRPFWYYARTPHTFGLGHPQSGVLAIRVWKAPYVSDEAADRGGLASPPLIGSSAAIAALKADYNYRWLRNRQYIHVLYLLITFVAPISFLAWLNNRRQKLLFWMSLFSIGPVLGLLLIGLQLPVSFALGLGWLQPIHALQDVSLWFLLLYLLQLDGDAALWRSAVVLGWISFVCNSLDGLLVFFDWSGPFGKFMGIADAALTVPITLVEAFPLVLVAFAFRKRLPLATWLVAAFAFLTEMTNVIAIAVSQGQRFTHWTLSQRIYAPLFFINGNPFTITVITTTLLFASIIYAVYRYSVEQSDRQAAIEQEFKSAQELQRVLIPETLPALQGFAVTSAYRPAQEVGGDFFQVIAQPDGSALILLGDVSGKGLKAAMTVSLIVGAARSFADLLSDPAEILTALNRRLHGRLKNGFVTCLILRLDPDGTCVFANAGHLAPFLNQQELALPAALPLGLLPSAQYDETAIHLEVGDRLTLYTDGLLEARNPTSGELYGFDRLRELLATQPDAQRATEAAVAFGQDDDITVLTITRLATGVESTTVLAAPELVLAGA